MKKFYIKTQEDEDLYISADYLEWGIGEPLKLFKDEEVIAVILVWNYWLEVEDELDEIE